MPDKLSWDQTLNPIKWDQNSYKWDEVFILAGIAHSGMAVEDAYQNLDKIRKKKLIKLLIKVNNKTISEEKYRKQNIKIISEDIRFAMKKILNIEINVNVKE